MLSSVLLLAATAFTGMVSAQLPYYSTSGPLAIHASDVTAGNRSAWCVSQRNECPFICGGTYNENNCDPDQLTYECTCANGNQPNISNYAGTLPSFICQQWVGFCVLNHPNDLLGQQGCQSVQCGMEKVDTSTSSSSNGTGSSGSDSSSSSSSPTTTSSSPSSSPTSTPTGSASGAASPTPTGNAAMLALSLGNSYGTGMFAAVVLAAFGLVL